jgi:hypothetical protein
MRAPPALFAKNAPVAQLDRASDYESEGRTFESFRARHFGIIQDKTAIGASDGTPTSEPRVQRRSFSGLRKLL